VFINSPERLSVSVRIKPSTLYALPSTLDACQRGVAIAWVGRDFRPDPRGQADLLVDPDKFDLGQHESLMGAGKDVDLPDQLALRDGEALLFDARSATKLEQRLGVPDRKSILELGARGAAFARFDRQCRRPPVSDAYADRCLPAARQTLGEETMWTLENFPSLAILEAAFLRTPPPQTISYEPAAEWTEMDFRLIERILKM